MFGGLVFMLNGNMCCGVRNTELMLRLSNELASGVGKRAHARPLDPTGRRIRSLVMVGEQGTDLDRDLEEWVEIAYSFVSTLPAKDPSASFKKRVHAAKPTKARMKRAKTKRTKPR